MSEPMLQYVYIMSQVADHTKKVFFLVILNDCFGIIRETRQSFLPIPETILMDGPLWCLASSSHINDGTPKKLEKNMVLGHHRDFDTIFALPEMNPKQCHTMIVPDIIFTTHVGEIWLLRMICLACGPSWLSQMVRPTKQVSLQNDGIHWAQVVTTRFVSL